MKITYLNIPLKYNTDVYLQNRRVAMQIKAAVYYVSNPGTLTKEMAYQVIVVVMWSIIYSPSHLLPQDWGNKLSS